MTSKNSYLKAKSLSMTKMKSLSPKMMPTMTTTMKMTMTKVWTKKAWRVMTTGIEEDSNMMKSSL